VVERARDLVLAETRAVVTFDEERDTPPFVDVARPCERAIKRVEFLVEQPILLQRRDRLRSSRPTIRYTFGTSWSSSGCNHMSNSAGSMMFQMELESARNLPKKSRVMKKGRPQPPLRS
jgi:hypothetical protein